VANFAPRVRVDATDAATIGDIQAIRRDGIGLVGSVPCVAAWYVDYPLPEVLQIYGDSNSIEVGPMRGSRVGRRASAGRLKSRKHEADYAVAQRLGGMMARSHLTTGRCVWEVRVRKDRPQFMHNQVQCAWNNELCSAFVAAMSNGHIREYGKLLTPDTLARVESKPDGLALFAYAARPDMIGALCRLMDERRNSWRLEGIM